jgi:glycerol-3-phosphate acyltransferase PlsY
MNYSWLPYLIIGYLIGCLPTAYLIGKWTRGIDIRKFGSGNVGTTNAFRVLGVKAGVSVFVIDILKGLLPLLVFEFLFQPSISPKIQFGVLEAVLTVHLAQKLCLAGGIILGHIWPVFLKFKGGKGVAPAIGIFSFLCPKISLIGIVIFGLIIATTRYVSLGSVIFVSVVAGLNLIFLSNKIISLFILIVALIIIIKHTSNITRLLKGKERKFGERV